MRMASLPALLNPEPGFHICPTIDDLALVHTRGGRGQQFVNVDGLHTVLEPPLSGYLRFPAESVHGPGKIFEAFIDVAD